MRIPKPDYELEDNKNSYSEAHISTNLTILRLAQTLILSITMVCLTPQALAINKCKDSSGNITFTDRPCDENTRSETIQLKSHGGEPSVDASSEEAMKSSMEKVLSSLSQDKREELKAAVLAILTTEFALYPNKTREEAIASVNTQLHGKTAKDIFILVDTIKSDPKIQKALRGLSSIQ